MSARASPRGFGVVVVVLFLAPFFFVCGSHQCVGGQEVEVQKQPRENEQDFERLRRQQLEGLQEAVWYATRLLWCILLALVALVVGMVLKSGEVRAPRPFDPARDRKKQSVSNDDKLES